MEGEQGRVGQESKAKELGGSVRKGEKGTQFVHTLNGTAVALSRAIIAVMENYQQADGSIAIPTELREYMNGMKVLSP